MGGGGEGTGGLTGCTQPLPVLGAQGELGRSCPLMPTAPRKGDLEEAGRSPVRTPVDTWSPVAPTPADEAEGTCTMRSRGGGPGR